MRLGIGAQIGVHDRHKWDTTKQPTRSPKKRLHRIRVGAMKEVHAMLDAQSNACVQNLCVESWVGYPILRMRLTIHPKQMTTRYVYRRNTGVFGAFGVWG